MNSASVLLSADAPLSRRPAASRLAHTAIETAESWPVAILGVPFDPVSSDETLNRVDAMIASRQPHYIVTANVDFLVQAHRDVELRRILVDADLVLCDGTPLLWASRWLGNALPERVAGSDLAPLLLRRAAARGHRVFFLGAGPGVAAAASERLLREFPTLQIVGHYSPPHAALLEMDHAVIAERIRDAAPDILLVSFGCPKQEKWISMHYRALGVPVCIGVGATIDFLAGRVKRAPQWMRHTGCEWLYRLAQEPRRLYRRYATDAWCFGPALAAQYRRMTTSPADDAGLRPSSRTVGGVQVIDAGPALTRAALQRHTTFWRDVRDQSVPWVMDLSRVEHIDATGVAFLVKCRKALHQQGRPLVLIAPQHRAHAALRSVRLIDFFTVVASVAEAIPQVAPRTQSVVATGDHADVLAWHDEVTAANVREIEGLTVQALQTLAARHARVVTIDLTAVRFIDSAAAGLMLRLRKAAQTLSIQLLFAHAQPNVLNVLRITRLDQLLLEGGQ